MALTPWIPEVFAVFCKAFSLPSFFLCSSNFSCCFFYNLSYFTLFCAGIYSFSLQHCFIFCSILWNSTCEMFSSWIACDMASLMLSDFACDEDLIELSFSCLQQENWVFWLGRWKPTLFRGCSMLMPDKTIHMDKTQPLVNAGIETLPVISNSSQTFHFFN